MQTKIIKTIIVATIVIILSFGVYLVFKSENGKASRFVVTFDKVYSSFFKKELFEKKDKKKEVIEEVNVEVSEIEETTKTDSIQDDNSSNQNEVEQPNVQNQNNEEQNNSSNLNPEINSGNLNPEVNLSGISDKIIETYKVVSGITATAPQLFKQLGNLNIDYKSLSILDIIDFYKKIQIVYGRDPEESGIHTYTGSKDMARLSTSTNGDSEIGPIIIVPAILKNNNAEQSVYLVALNGTEFVEGQATGILTDIVTGLQLNNDYLKAAHDSILKTVPKNSKLVVTGLSLGGMIAQQLVAQEGIKTNYEILNVISFGAPIIMPESRNCVVKRMTDSNDLIPMLSISNTAINEQKYDSIERVTENGGYKTPIGAHVFSYVDNSVWDKYDVLGFENGGNSITYDNTKIQYFDAPTS